MRSLIKPVFGAFLCTLGLLSGVAAADHRAGAAPFVVAQAEDDQGAMGDQPGSVAALTVRMDRLEGTIRSLTGQIEELQFQNRKLAEDLRKMQQDVDFRFQDLNRGGGNAPPPLKPGKRTDVDPAAMPAAPSGSAGLPQDASGIDAAVPVSESVTVPRLVRRTGDAFDPAVNPNAPGVPRPLGSTAPSQPLSTAATGAAISRRAEATPNAPLDLMRRVPADDPVVPPAAVPDVPASRPTGPNPNAVASLMPGGTRDEYNGDVDLYKQGQYDGAANGLKSFIDKYPRDRLVPDAVYLLGETYSKLGRHREAAEQYLRLSTDFSKAPRAPDALLRLGMSLNAMGVKEQACATYEEVTRRYPASSAELRASVDREVKRARC